MTYADLAQHLDTIRRARGTDWATQIILQGLYSAATRYSAAMSAYVCSLAPEALEALVDRLAMEVSYLTEAAVIDWVRARAHAA
jgi:hypothetical protein